MPYVKWLAIGMRIQGLILIYFFFSQAMSIINLLVGYGELRQHSLEGVVLHGLLDLFTGIYLTFYPAGILNLILKDGFVGGDDQLGNDPEYAKLLGIGIKLFGIHIFGQFLYYTVTTFNVMAGFYTPGKTEAAGFCVQAVFHLLLALALLTRTRELVAIMIRSRPAESPVQAQ
ncbi:MAG: hypothetical protein JWO30_4632 [Fibrobacteres bacterium]|nr:hypothetical protein [Fibrobacterota bacterium]